MSARGNGRWFCMAVRIICESAELAVECLQAAQAIGLRSEPEVATDWLRPRPRSTRRAAVRSGLSETPALEQLVEIGHVARAQSARVVLAQPRRDAEAERLRQVALDLGVSAVAEIEPLIGALRCSSRRRQPVDGHAARC